MPPFDTEVPAVLLRLDPNPFHHGTLGAVRSLGRAGIEVHVVVESAPGPVGRLPLSAPRASAAARRRLGRGAGTGTAPASRTRSAGRPSSSPMDDRSAIAVAALSATAWRAAYLLPAIAPDLPERRRRQGRTRRALRGSGVPHPTTIAPASPAEAAYEAARSDCRWSRSGAAPGCCRRDCAAPRWYGRPHDAHELSERTARGRAAGCCCSACCPAGAARDWFFHGYAAPGAVASSPAAPAARSGPGRARTGLTAVGRWIANSEVEEAAATARRRARLPRHPRPRLPAGRRRPARTTCWTSTRAPAPSSGSSRTTRGWTSYVRSTCTSPGARCPARRGAPGRVFVAENYALLSALVAAASLGLSGRDADRRTGRTTCRDAALRTRRRARGARLVLGGRSGPVLRHGQLLAPPRHAQDLAARQVRERPRAPGRSAGAAVDTHSRRHS